MLSIDQRLAIRLRTSALLVWIVVICRQPPDLLPAFLPDAGDGFGIVGILASSTQAAAIIYSQAFVGTVRVTSIALCLLALLRPGSAGILRVAAVFVVVWDSLNKSIGGYANHAQFIPLSLLVIFAIHQVGSYVWFPPGRRDANVTWDASGGSMTSVACALWQSGLCVVLPYTYVGVNRLLEGGLDILRSDALSIHMRSACMAMPSDTCVWLASLPLDAYSGVLAIGLPVVTLMEVLSVLILVSRVFRIGWLLFMLGFQLLAAIGMNIIFWENMVILAVLLCSAIFSSPLGRSAIVVPAGTRSLDRVDTPT